MSITKAIYEHLITKKKYNTLKLKYEVAREDLERKQVELNTERRIRLKEKEIWEQRLKDQEEEIIKLKRRRRKNEGKQSSTDNS
jgi:hypothetical protein